MITIAVVILVLALAYTVAVWTSPGSPMNGDVSKCIGEKAVLYTQLGCSACKTQEEIFGEYYEKLTVIDCFYEREKCVGAIEYTPTWIINEEKIVGIKSIEKLKELTNC